VDAGRVNRLVEQLDDDSFDVRQEADERLRSIGKAAVPQLRDALARTRSLEVRARLRRMVHDLTIDERVGELARQLADEDAATRERAAWALRKAGPCVVPWLQRELTGELPSEQRRRVETLIAELALGR
jgi:HEAT repeat protein